MLKHDGGTQWWGAAFGMFLIVLACTPSFAADLAAVNPQPASIPGMAPVGTPPAGDPAPIGSRVSDGSSAIPANEYTYNPSGRRDPFAAILKDGRGDSNEDLSIPPLQRLSLTELNLIGIIWGGFGYSAMVQAPDGRGYTLRPGTRIGPNNGVVSSITENAIVVHERFTDVYGNKQVREYVKLLHAKEGTE
ncbi:pilus assembly protein PilP [Candidatus Nitrospira bockiana]